MSHIDDLPTESVTDPDAMFGTFAHGEQSRGCVIGAAVIFVAMAILGLWAVLSGGGK